MHRTLYRNHGFTLVEMMVLVSIIGIIAAIAVPSFNGYMRANRIDVMADQISTDLALARSLAVCQGQVIRFDGVVDGYTITNMSSGRVLRQREFSDDVSLTVDVSINFFPWGAAEAATLDLDNGHQTRQLQVLPTGIVEE